MRTVRTRLAVLALLVGLIGMAVACGDGDDGGPAPVAAEGVELTADVRLVDRQVEFDYRLANDGDEAVAAVDPQGFVNGSRTDKLGDGRYRYVLQRREEGSEGGGDLDATPSQGLRLAAGEMVEGSAGLVGRIEHRLDGVELCVEIVPSGGRAGDEPGVAVLDRRDPDEPPVLACTGVLDVEDATG